MFTPQTELPGVVYPDPTDTARWVNDGALTDETLAEAFRKSVRLHADSVALIWPEGQLTYTELDAATDKIAAGFLQLGLQPHDRVVFQLSNAPETLMAFLACFKAAIIPICTLALHREAEIGYLADFGGAKAHIIESDAPKFDFHDFAETMQGKVPGLNLIISTRDTARNSALDMASFLDLDLEEARAQLVTVPQDPWQVAVFQLSGGTTGVPKIIPRMNAAYVYNMRQVWNAKGWMPEDRMLVPMPFAHNLAMGCCWGPFLLNGGSVITITKTDPEAMRNVHNDLKPSVMAAAKPIIMRMKDDIAQGRISVRNLKEIFSTDGAEVVTKQLGVAGHQQFGMTEGTIMVTSEGDSEFVRFHTCGKPISEFDEIRLLKPGTEEVVQRGEIGELAVFGPYTLRGYYNAPERNAEAFTSDGFYRSGDLLKCHRIDGLDYYSFEGRIKDVVDRADEKINCEEVERVVILHLAFTDVAIVGMPSPTHGEKVCLYGVLAEGQTAPDVKDLGAFLKDKGLAIFKWPERIEIIDALPLTKVGKLDKVALRQRIAETLAAEAKAVAS